MYFLTLLVAAAVSTTTFAASPPGIFVGTFDITITNNCHFAVYTRTNYNGGGSSTTEFIMPGGISRQDIQPSGAAVLVGTHEALTAPLTLGYTPSEDTTYYDLSNNAGNPFANYSVLLIPGPQVSCGITACGPHASDCYSNSANIKVKTCRNTGFELELCSPPADHRSLPTPESFNLFVYDPENRYINGEQVSAAEHMFWVNKPTAIYHQCTHSEACGSSTNNTVFDLDPKQMGTTFKGWQDYFVLANGTFGYTAAGNRSTFINAVADFDHFTVDGGLVFYYTQNGKIVDWIACEVEDIQYVIVANVTGLNQTRYGHCPIVELRYAGVPYGSVGGFEYI